MIMSDPSIRSPGPGDPVPAFHLPTIDGHVSGPALSGRPYVVYFYPKDDTPGCTKEAIAFTRLDPAFRDLNIAVIGISRDSLTKHETFRDKHDLGVMLASDGDGAVCEAFGVWVEKSMYGRKYMGIERSTFLVGPTGRIVQVWRKVKVTGHAEAVLAAAQRAFSTAGA